MNHRWILFALLIVGLSGLTACETASPAPTVPQSAATTPVPAPTDVASAATNAPTAAPQKTAASSPTPVKGALTCPPITPLPANAPLAARVNGQGIALDLYNRQAAQAQAAMVQNTGLDPKSSSGQETLKSVKQQVLDQMINEIVIAQQAEREGIKVTDNDLNARIAQMIQDAGSVDKLNEYMAKNQLTLADLCLQVRNQLLGDAMLNRITAALPTQVEQVHVRHILVSTPALAQTLRDRARKGEDFAALAKQYSIDETNKANGGDMSWLPRGVLDPRIDAVMFEIPAGQVSDVITTNFGYHIIQVLEKDKSRPLPPELIQDARQKAFLAWLQAVRETLTIERLVQP